jgi:guanylate kinase
MAGILFIISAPSGSGKSTLVSEVRRLVEGLEFSISYTTREPRGSEEDGREYHFTSRENFERMIAEGEFLEWATVFGNYYGTALQVMQRLPEAVSIFILPPSPQVLEMRLRNRSQAEGMTREAVIETRLANAKNELLKIGDYKYALVNDVLDHAAAEMRAIVLAERGEAADDLPAAVACLTRSRSARLSEALASFGVQPVKV